MGRHPLIGVAQPIPLTCTTSKNPQDSQGLKGKKGKDDVVDSFWDLGPDPAPPRALFAPV